MKPLVLAVALLGAVTLSTQGCAQIFDDPFSQYAERSLTITPGAGNDQGVNAAIQTIDPWPPYAGYTRIPARGEHAVDSIVRLNKTPEPFQSQQSSGGGQAGGGAGSSQTGFGSATGGGGGSTPMQPISGQ
jgi:uncharacterized membrane protein YgcG